MIIPRNWASLPYRLTFKAGTAHAVTVLAVKKAA